MFGERIYNCIESICNFFNKKQRLSTSTPCCGRRDNKIYYNRPHRKPPTVVHKKGQWYNVDL